MLELKHVAKNFDGLQAVHDVSLRIQEGQLVGLIGPNGSGKSTLINVISGMLEPSSGQIYFDKHDITNLAPNATFDLGLARGFQDPALFFQMTTLDNTLLPAKEQKGEHPWYAPWRRFWAQQERDNAGIADQILRRVKLRESFHKPAADLSGGQMKLLDIARCLIGQPKMLLLDEPTAGVAPALAYEIFEQIAELRQTLGVTCLIVEHRLEILFDFVDYVYVMHMGEILAHGTPEEIRANVSTREVYFGADE